MNNSTIKEAFKLINYIEEVVNIQEWEVEGIHVWPLVRHRIKNKLDPVTDSHKHDKSHLKKLRLHIHGVFKLIKTFVKNPKEFRYTLSECSVLFMTYSNAKHNKLEGRWVNSHIEAIADVLERYGVTYNIIEHDKNYSYRLPGLKKSKKIQHRISLNNLKARVKEKSVDLKNSDEYVSEINTILNEKGFTDGIINLSYIRKRVAQLLEQKKYFKKILKKCNPKVVFLANYPGVQSAMILACEEMGITSVDIQHGVQGAYHVAYGNWKKVPESGYNILPDIFAVWSDRDKKNIEKWARTTAHRSIVIGNTNAHYISQVPKKDEQLLQLYDTSKINVLISMQPIEGGIYGFDKLLKLADNRMFFWLRAHPAMTSPIRNEFSASIKKYKNCNFDIATSSFLYELLPLMDVHITQSSTVTLEAAGFNIPTIVMHKMGLAYYSNLMPPDQIYFENQPKKIISRIYQLGNKKKERKYEINHKDFEKKVLYIINTLGGHSKGHMKSTNT